MTITEDARITVDERCSCRGQNLEKLIRPALLILLTRSELCGYRVVQQLSEMPMFDGEKPNASGVYRALSAMAEEELVTASWDTSAPGPAKRLYHITDKGRACLGVWLETLAKYRDSINDLLAAGNDALGKEYNRSCGSLGECN